MSKSPKAPITVKWETCAVVMCKTLRKPERNFAEFCANIAGLFDVCHRAVRHTLATLNFLDMPSQVAVTQQYELDTVIANDPINIRWFEGSAHMKVGIDHTLTMNLVNLRCAPFNEPWDKAITAVVKPSDGRFQYVIDAIFNDDLLEIQVNCGSLRVHAVWAEGKLNSVGVLDSEDDDEATGLVVDVKSSIGKIEGPARLSSTQQTAFSLLLHSLANYLQRDREG